MRLRQQRAGRSLAPVATLALRATDEEIEQRVIGLRRAVRDCWRSKAVLSWRRALSPAFWTRRERGYHLI
jgi:hypothetical protein